MSVLLLQTFPFFGVKPLLLDECGIEIKGEGEGYLVFSQPWPGMMRTLYNNHERFEDTYFSKFPGYYCTGDGEFNWHTGSMHIVILYKSCQYRSSSRC